MIRIDVRRGNAAIAGALLLSAAACGGSGGSHPSQPDTTRPAAGDIAAKSGAEILAAAKDALVHARSVRIKGTMNLDQGSMSMNMRVGHPPVSAEPGPGKPVGDMPRHPEHCAVCC
ncbi:hypothetical protein GCM10029978_034660 [Actinoallomurus acanthiterrae]